MRKTHRCIDGLRNLAPSRIDLEAAAIGPEHTRLEIALEVGEGAYIVMAGAQ